MRISASVEVSNRLLPSLNIRMRRPEKSYLNIGYIRMDRKDVFILHQTIRNGAGVRYKVHNNILGVFDKFISDGKATIRFAEPSVDLIIKGEASKLKLFIKIVKVALKGDISVFKQDLTNLHAAPTRVVSEPSTKLIFKRKCDIPSFPRHLEYLEISKACLTKFDNRILRLQKLRVLNLEDNNIDEIPDQIDLLPVLEELYLARNQMGKKMNFKWLQGISIQKNISHLDLSENNMTYVPWEICRLMNLKKLLLHKNSIRRIPPAFGRLKNLQVLGLDDNQLIWLPGSFQLLKLRELYVAGNKWKNDWVPPTRRDFSLVTIAATVVLRQGLKYSEETLPRTLIDFMETAGYCFCGAPVIPESPNNLIPFVRLYRGNYMMYSTAGEVPLIALTCCMQKNENSAVLCSYHLDIH